MNSQRELIVRNIVDVLKNQQTLRLGTVSRDPGLALEDLAATAFPAVIIESGNESRESITQGGGSATRQARMEVNITVWTNSHASADTQRNDLIEGIEELLELDASRGGVALDTQLTSVITDNSQTAPYIAMVMTFEIGYLYIKGNV